MTGIGVVGDIGQVWLHCADGCGDLTNPVDFLSAEVVAEVVREHVCLYRTTR